MSIFESLENLPVSEACFNDIISLVEEFINESPKVGTVKNAVNTSLPLRMETYKALKKNPNATPAQIKAASDKVDHAVDVKNSFKVLPSSMNNAKINKGTEARAREAIDQHDEEESSNFNDEKIGKEAIPNQKGGTFKKFKKQGIETHGVSDQTQNSNKGIVGAHNLVNAIKTLKGNNYMEQPPNEVKVPGGMPKQPGLPRYEHQNRGFHQYS